MTEKEATISSTAAGGTNIMSIFLLCFSRDNANVQCDSSQNVSCILVSLL